MDLPCHRCKYRPSTVGGYEVGDWAYEKELSDRRAWY